VANFCARPDLGISLWCMCVCERERERERERDRERERERERMGAGDCRIMKAYKGILFEVCAIMLSSCSCTLGPHSCQVSETLLRGLKTNCYEALSHAAMMPCYPHVVCSSARALQLEATFEA
jgi:hypothetical protein